MMTGTIKRGLPVLLLALLLIQAGVPARSWAESGAFAGNIYDPGTLKPTDSVSTVRVGDRAPDFDLPAVAGGRVRLSSFAGKKNVVISFVPAAWTPICSDQWPGYNAFREIFDDHNAILLGITVDNIPTLFAWTRQMDPSGDGVWFPVLSDFWPHGGTASRYGVLRSDGTSERALFVIDKKGIIRWIDVHDINKRPNLEDLAHALEGLKN
jgi:alkyl hydroperoxide reductase subunit AhpC